MNRDQFYKKIDSFNDELIKLRRHIHAQVLFDKPNIAQPTIPIGAVEIISLRLPNTPAK